MVRPIERYKTERASTERAREIVDNRNKEGTVKERRTNEWREWMHGLDGHQRSMFRLE